MRATTQTNLRLAASFQEFGEPVSMGRSKFKAPKRYCEVCGRPIESRDPDMYLCRVCAWEQERERERSRRRRQAFRRRRREELMEDSDMIPLQRSRRTKGRKNRVRDWDVVDWEE